MKILSNLRADVIEGVWAQVSNAQAVALNSVDAWLPKGSHFIVADEIIDSDGERTGFFRQVMMFENGVVINHGEKTVGIPLSQLLKLAESVEPGLRP